MTISSLKNRWWQTYGKYIEHDDTPQSRKIRIQMKWNERKAKRLAHKLNIEIPKNVNIEKVEKI